MDLCPRGCAVNLVRWIAGLAVASELIAAVPVLHVRVPMRDGVTLCTNVFLPSTSSRFPAILVRTPYGKGSQPGTYSFLASRGYAIVLQDVRGRYHSGGTFRSIDQEGPDGDDTIKWIARQKWCNGNIGMAGASYAGMAQWKAAEMNNPNLKAIFPIFAGSDEYLDRYYSPGGALRLGHRLLWMAGSFRARDFASPGFDRYVLHLPLRTADRAATGQRLAFFQSALDHPTYDAYWRTIRSRDSLSRIRTPAFSIGGWYDNYVQGDLEAFSVLGKTGRHWLVVGPWAHDMSAKFEATDFGLQSALAVRKLQLEWFEYWLKPHPRGVKSAFPQPPLRMFVMGANQWRDEREWPLERSHEVPFYLSSGGHANSIEGDGVLADRPDWHQAFDSYVYDPLKPVPTRGGAVCCNPKVFPWGPMDQRPVEARHDVLVYTTPELDEDVEATGPVRVVLFVSTSAPDTDFTAKLVDAGPDGYARNLTDGILRLRYRESLERPVSAIPGEVYQISIDAGVTGHVFKTRHRIRLEISSSNFPRFDRNLNTGRRAADDTQIHTAVQRIYHGRRHPSRLILPVVPAGAERANPGAASSSNSLCYTEVRLFRLVSRLPQITLFGRGPGTGTDRHKN